MVFLVVGTVVVVFGLDIGGHKAGFPNLWSNPGGFWPTEDPYNWYGPILVMSGVVFAYAAIEMVGVAAGEMEDSEREVPKAVNAVIFRIGVFYCGSILLLVSHAADHRVHGRHQPVRDRLRAAGPDLDGAA